MVCLVVSGIVVLVLLGTTSHSVLPKVYAEAEDVNLAGTWNVTAMFPQCTAKCPCPGGVPNIPIPAVHTYVHDGSFVEVPGGTLFRGSGLGSWKRSDDDHFVAHFKFFLFNPPPSHPGDPPEGSRRGNEVVTSDIDLTGPNTFTAHARFDLFDAAGTTKVNDDEVCNINETATRFGPT